MDADREEIKIVQRQKFRLITRTLRRKKKTSPKIGIKMHIATGSIVLYKSKMDAQKARLENHNEHQENTEHHFCIIHYSQIREIAEWLQQIQDLGRKKSVQIRKGVSLEIELAHDRSFMKFRKTLPSGQVEDYVEQDKEKVAKLISDFYKFADLQ